MAREKGPAAAIPAAAQTSGRLLRRRRGAGEAGEAGDDGGGRGPPESPLGATRGGGKVSCLLDSHIYFGTGNNK